MRISDWSSDVCSSDLYAAGAEFLLTMAISLVMLVLVPRLGAMLAFLLGGGIAAVLLAGAWFAFSGAGMLLSVVYPLDRKSVVSGTSVSVRVDLGGRRIIKKKNSTNTCQTLIPS